MARLVPSSGAAAHEALRRGAKVGFLLQRDPSINDVKPADVHPIGTAGVLTPEKRDDLAQLYHRLNPLQLRRDLDAALAHLWTLAAPDPLRAQGDTEVAPPSLKSSPEGS